MSTTHHKHNRFVKQQIASGDKFINKPITISLPNVSTSGH